MNSYLVIGRGRSGTSLVARILHKLGVFMGDSFKPAEAWNKHGFWEDKHFLELNLDMVGLDFHVERVLSEEEVKPYQERAKKLVESHQREKWGFKDERTLLTINAYLPFLQNPHFIVCTRDFDNHIKSSCQVHKGTIEELQEDIHMYNWLIKEFFNKYDYPRLDIHHETLLNKPEREIKRICDFTNLPYQDVRQEIKNR